MSREFVFDTSREARIGLAEALFCAAKQPAQIDAAVAELAGRGARMLLTRLDPALHERLAPATRERLDYHPLSRTAYLGMPEPARGPARVAVVTAGTSDLAVAAEAERTLAFAGIACTGRADIGVAGLWRLLEHREQLAAHPVVIAVAGMEGAFFSVLGGLVGSVVIAVPTSTGYGVTAGGKAALASALGSCAPGILAVNIDNGYGAACAAIRVLNALGQHG